MTNIKINIRPSTGQVFQVDIELDSMTVQDLKQVIAQKMGDVESSNLKLVFSGRILKNEDLLVDSKITTGCTIHVVRSGVNKAPSTKASTSTAPAVTTTTTNNDSTSRQPQTSDSNTTIPTTPNYPNLSSFGGGNGASPFGDMQMPNIDPEVMSQMMDSPFMQNLLGNTDFVQSIIMSNPQMKALVEQNPELRHVISDPAFLRQSMEMMRNPELMREMQRNNDRALSNIEAIPGGFNYLRRMYNTVQSPLENAMSSGTRNNADEANNERLARQLNVQSIPENSLNTQALPNPWARPSSNNDSNSSTTTTTNTNSNNNTSNNNNNNNNNNNFGNPFAAFGGSGNSMDNPFAALLGGGASPFGQPQTQQSQQQQQQQQTPFWADPNFIQASLRMQALMSAQNNNNGNTETSTQQQQQQQPNLFQQLMMGYPYGGFGGMMPEFQQPQNTPTEPPEVRFRDQLAQLEEMGFSEKTRNIRALLASGGNVQGAVDYLISRPNDS